MRLQAENFQSWPAVCLDIEGFTSVVGPSDLGKSAVFRMLKGVLRNDISSAHIKNGEDKTCVKITLEQDEIEAKRSTKGSVSYRVNGADYAKLAGNVPEVVANLNYGPIHIGNTELDPIFGGQFDNQFLLTSSPADLNAVLGAFSSTEKLDQGKKKVVVKVREIEAESKVLAGLVQESEAKALQIEAFLQTVQDNVDQITASETSIDETSRVIGVVDNLGQVLENKQRLESNLKDIGRLLSVDTSQVRQTMSAVEDLSAYRISRYMVTLGESIIEKRREIDFGIDLANERITVLNLLSILEKKTLDTKPLVKAFDKLGPDILGQLEDKMTNCLLMSNILAYDMALSQLQKESRDLEDRTDRVIKLAATYKKQLSQMEEESKQIECPECGYVFKLEDTNGSN